MAKTKVQRGDRVRVRPSESWLQPIRGWAEKGRMATVISTGVPDGPRGEMIHIMFDHRAGASAHNFRAYVREKDLDFVERPA